MVISAHTNWCHIRLDITSLPVKKFKMGTKSLSITTPPPLGNDIWFLPQNTSRLNHTIIKTSGTVVKLVVFWMIYSYMNM